MVFENLTLFEVHFEDASFGPTLTGEESDSTAEAEATSGDEADDGGGIPVGRLLLASVVVSIVVAWLAKRLADGEVPDVDIDAPEEPVDVSIDS